MKKALAGPAKPTAKKLPERRAMIAAVRRRIVAALAYPVSLTGKLDRLANRGLERAQPPLARWALRLRRLTAALGGPRRPAGAPRSGAALPRAGGRGALAAAGRAGGQPRRDPGQRRADADAGDLRGDRRRGRLPRRLPVHRLPRGRGRPARLRGPAGDRGTAHRRGEDGRAGSLLPLGPPRPARRRASPWRRCARGGAGWPARSSSSASSRSRSSSSSTGRTAWRSAPRPPASPAPTRCSTRASTPSWRPRRHWCSADCSTMRGRAEYESTCQEGPQAP